MANLNNLKTTVLVSSSVTTSVLDGFVKRVELGSMAFQNDVDESLPGYEDNRYARKQGEWVRIESGTDPIEFYTGLSVNENLTYEEDFQTGRIEKTDYASDYDYTYEVPEEPEMYIWWCSNYPIKSVREVNNGTISPPMSLYTQPMSISFEGKDLYCYRAKFLPLPRELKYRISINN